MDAAPRIDQSLLVLTHDSFRQIYEWVLCRCDNDVQLVQTLESNMCQKNLAIELATYACTDFAKAQAPKENQSQSSPISMLLPNST